MCAAYSPPIEDITQFNSSLFNQPEETLTQAEANLLYLSKVNSNTSSAPLTTFNNAVTIGGTVILGQTTITDGQNFNARQILSSNTGATISHSLFTNMGIGSTLTIGNSNSTNVQVNSILIANSGFTMKQNSSCENTFSVNTIALQVTAGTKNFWTAAAGTTTINIGNILAPLNLNASTFTIAGTTAVFNSGVTCNNGLSANGVTAGDYDTQNTTTLCRICNSTTSGTIRLGAGLNSLGNIEIGSNTGNNTIKGLTSFTQTATFSAIPNCSVSANSANQLVNYTTLTTQGFTTLPLVQSNNNIFTGTNQFNQPIKIQYAAAQYTDLNQTAQSFKILNKSTGGNIQFECRTVGLIDTEVATFNTTGITLGINTGTNTISGNTTFNHNVSITGNLTAGNLSQINTISGNTTFNQNLSVTGTAGITGVLTASSGLKTGDITPNISSAQQNIYTGLGIGGTIFFGTASRTMNIYGNVNMANTCQFSNALQTNDITHIGTQSNTAKNIYTGLTTGGSVTLGATTANTTTNIRGGAINLGGSSNILTIDSPTTFNNLLKSDDITAITTNATHSIYTTLTSSGTINLGNATSGTITNINGGTINLTSSDSTTFFSQATFNSNMMCKAGFYFTDIVTGSLTDIAKIFQQNNVLRFDTNVNYANTYEFWCSSDLIFQIEQLTSYIYNTLNIIGSLKIRNDKLVDELQTLTGTSHTLVFPLEQTTVFTNTANISVTLPLINNDSQLGLRFTFVSLGSITTTVTFNRQGTNLIIPVGQMTQFTSVAIINNTKTICNLVIVKLGGIYIWTEYTF